MPIKISVESNFLKVEGNDPERIYYERSRVSHELFPTYVQLRYDNNKLAQLDLTTLDSTNTAFTSLSAIVAFLTQVGDGDTGDGTVSAGGGGLTQAQAQAAFTAALQSQNQVEFQDILLEDANGVVYISTRQIDEETGAITFTSRLPDGTAHTPVAPVKVPQTQVATSEALYFRVMTGNGVNTSNGDYISKEITRNSTGAVTNTRWFNITQNTPIASPLPNQTDLKLWNRLVDDAVNGTRTAVDSINLYTTFLASRIDFRTDFWANIAGAGYSVGDRLEQVTLNNGNVVWWNRTTNNVLSTTPVTTNLVKAIGECFVSVNVSSVAHSADTPMSSNTFTDTPAITIPTIDGKKANTLYFYRTATTTASPLYPNDLGALFGAYSGASTIRVPLGSGAVNRDAQFNIAPSGSYVRLNKELTNIFIRNYNLSVNTFTFQFSYQEIDNPELDTSQGLGYRAVVFENNLTATSTDITLLVDVKNIIMQIFCNGATTPVTFSLEQTISLAGGGRQFIVQTITLPTGTNTGHFQIPYKARTGRFKIVPTGTFTNYSYKLLFNEGNV